MRLLLLWIIFGLALLISCGKKDDDPYQLMRQDTTQEGVYTTSLHSVNKKISKNISGKVRISKYGDEFKVDVRLKNAPDGTHRQYIHAGKGCPTDSMDINKDGFIDVEESKAVIGMGILPLDGDLSSRELGHNDFPQGSYVYSRSASYSRMLANIGTPVEDLPLDGRAIVIYGVPKNISLPVSVAAKDQLQVHESIPIACGILKLSYGEVDMEEWTESERPTRTVRPRPRPRPNPRTGSNSGSTPDPWPDNWEPESGGGSSGDGEGGGLSWWDRVRNWWRCRFGRCAEE